MTTVIFYLWTYLGNRLNIYFTFYLQTDQYLIATSESSVVSQIGLAELIYVS